MKKRKDYDYYIFIDYSGDLIGISIIKQLKIRDLLPKISKFAHYKEKKKRKIYLRNIKETINRENIKSYFEKIKIESVRKNLDLISIVLDFVKKHKNCIIFISIDDYQFKKLRKIIKLIDGHNVEILKESELKKGTPEHKVSLVIDNLLNIERISRK